ncbi:MAG: transposase [Deltaproteobacteria bacterium]|nr:transposase [Deltaproteobacteria bacterium]
MPLSLKGNPARHLATLAGLITGIVMIQKVQLPKLAARIPDSVKETSTEKRLYRWIKNGRISHETHFLPSIQPLLSAVANTPLMLVIDGSTVGRNCLALMVCLVSKQRALPIAWTVTKGKKGHIPEPMHVQLVQEVQKLFPENARVVLLEDGEFDGTNLRTTLAKAGRRYFLRTYKSPLLIWQGHEFSFNDVTDCVAQGDRFYRPNALFTRKRCEPIQATTWWRQDCQEPIHPVANLSSIDDACRYYTQRFKIETFFSDQKGRGFHFHKSHISDPKRISRLLIAACLAYHWVVHLGVPAIKNQKRMPSLHSSHGTL